LNSCIASGNGVGRLRLLNGHRDRHGRKVFVGVEVGRRRRGSQPGQEDQLRRLPSVERQFDDALVVDDLANAGRVCFDHRGVGRHRDRFAHRAHSQRDVDLRIGAHLQDDAVLGIGVEPL
jgi:hypothetical protein